MGRYTGKKCRLLSMFGLTAGFFLVEIIVGYVTNSMALVADSFHMLSDIAALIIAFMSVKMAPKSWDKNTYGWARAEVLGALVNAVFLVALCFSITIESAKRFYEPEEIHNPKMILIVGALGLVVNLLGLCLFHEHGGGHGHSHGGHGHGHSHGGHGTHSHLAALANTDGEVPKSIEDAQNHHLNAEPKKTSGKNGHSHGGGSSSQMNMRGVFLHVMGDALGSVVVIISALIMWRTEWEYKFYVDPALSLVMVCIMMRGVWPLLIESALILLQTVPTHIDVDVLKKKLLENIDGILAVHDFHVWQLTGDRIIASAHIRCLNLSEYMKVAENIKEFFHNEGIHSTTIQPEFVDFHQQPADGNGNEDCVLSCSKVVEKDCEALKCCTKDKVEATNSNGSSNSSSGHNLKRSSRSAQNTPTSARRPTSFTEKESNSFRTRRENGPRSGQQHPHHQNEDQEKDFNIRSTTCVTSTPNRQSAPNLSSSISVSGSVFCEQNKLTSPTVANDLTAEIDLSDDLTAGITPIQDSFEDTPMFTPRTNSRIVRIISKQSNV